MKTPNPLPILMTFAIALACAALLVAWPPTAEQDRLVAAHTLAAAIR